MDTCYICGSRQPGKVLDFGAQPVCSRFLKNPTQEEYLHPLTIGQCNTCGLIQISNPVPYEKLKPIYDWIIYSEPEEHLARLAEVIISLPGISKESSVCGMSFKDDSILELFKKRGLQNVWRIDPISDLDIQDTKAGIENVQARFDLEKAERISKRYGQPDVIIARHFLEHTFSFSIFMQAIKKLVRPQGYIVLEVPDCKKAIETYDCSTIWEEHLLYFTTATFKHAFSLAGYSLVYYESFPYPLEDSLVGIGRLGRQIQHSLLDKGVLKNEIKRMIVYSNGLKKQCKKLKEFLAETCRNGNNIAMLGAGHLACTFINLLGLKDFIKFIVDDNPKKQGLFMPGSRVPIYGSSSLLDKDIKLCLLSIPPDKEEKVITKNKNFLEKGGSFYSIFPGSRRFLPI